MQAGPSVPHQVHAAFTPEGLEALQALLQRSPCAFGLDTGVWTWEQLAWVCWKLGLTDKQATADPIGKQLKRQGLAWEFVKDHINRAFRYIGKNLYRFAQ